MAETTTLKRMTSPEYYELVDRLHKCYSSFFPGAGTKSNLQFQGFWGSDSIRFRYRSKLDALMFIAHLHESLIDSLISRRVLSVEEGEWVIDCSFNLEPEEDKILADLREKLEVYEIMYLK